MQFKNKSTRTAFFIGAGFFLLIVILELAAILRLNQGFFVYTLDDAYIHLALAENIAQGHYGINPGELSAPSSSILWPFLIAPLASFEYFPFIVNVVFSLITLAVLAHMLAEMLDVQDSPARAAMTAALMVLFILVTNMVGLVFIGMEHALQVLVTAVIVWGLIREVRHERLDGWLPAVIALGPLVRYELLGISLSGICYLFLRKYTKQAGAALLLTLLPLAGFSYYLVSLGLAPFPTSVLVKSSVVESGGSWGSLLANINISLIHSRGRLLLLGAIFLLGVALFSKENLNRRKLAAASLTAVLLHLVVGKYGFYYRYEIYIWAFVLLVGLFLANGLLKQVLQPDRDLFSRVKVILLFVFLVTACYQYIFALTGLPLASNNIYQQHYQMRRFAAEFYRQPVAVNDIGYVSYKNDHYVLDLWGLASAEALHMRLTRPDSGWVNDLAQSKNVQFAMIYEDWFGNIPEGWIKMGELHLGSRLVTPQQSSVSFFALNRQVYEGSLPLLQSFIQTLPEGVEFILDQETESR